MWYEWSSLESFEAWHTAKKLELGYPIAGKNQKTGEVDENSQWTTEYTTPFFVEDKVIAIVDSIHAEGLIETDLRLPLPERE